MSRIVTDPDSGMREYFIEQATPPRWMRSLTTILKAGANPALIYAAGKLGMDATNELAHELAQDGGDPEDFGYRLERLCGERFGRAKTAPFNIKPPHMGEWARKADTGSAVHNAIEREVKLRLGLPAPAEYDLSKFTDEQKAGNAKALAAWEAWKTPAEFTPLASEEVVWIEGWTDSGRVLQVGFPPRFDIVCRIDLFCTVAGRRIIADVKTGKVDRTGPYPNQWLQVEAQRRCWNEQHPEDKAEAAGILHVPAAGGPVKLYTNEDRDRAADFEAVDNLNGFSRWMFGPVKGDK